MLEGGTVERISTEIMLRIDWSEIDNFGHVNNLATLKYVQAARVQLLEMLGLMPTGNIGPVLAAISCQFRKPLYYPGQVTVRSKVGEIKTTSFGITHEVYNDAGELAAEAHDVLVLFDFRKESKVALSEDLKARLRSATTSSERPAPAPR
jgi:acyl-CoA thioester hydrolase